MQPIITIKDLCVNYGDYKALENISFSVERGDFLAVVGQNGSGKTTLIKTIVGLIKPHDGEVVYHNPDDILGYLPQKMAMLDIRFPASVEEVVALGLKSAKEKNAKEKLDKVLNLLEISDIRKRKIGQLSGGQQQRAALARALINSPSILVLDEPTGALDPSSRECFFDTIKKMNEEQNMTVIMVSHDFYDIKNYVKTVALIDRTLLSFGKSQEFLSGGNKHYFNHNQKHSHSCGR